MRVRLHESSGDLVLTAEIAPIGLVADPTADVIRWRSMDFVYRYTDITTGEAVYSRSTSTTVNWYPNEKGEKWTD